MFEPIFDINRDQVGDFSMYAFIILTIVAYGWTILVNAKRYVMSEELTWFNPLVYAFDSGDYSLDSEMRMLDVVFGAMWFLFGIAPVLVLITIINWCWLPLLIIGGIMAGLKGARSIVSLNRQLNDHKEDKNVHTD